MLILTWIIGTLTISYMLGSIPFGLIIMRLAGAGDLRAIGSGNIGTTNVMRTGRKGLGILTLFLDGGKGFAAVWLVRYLYMHDLGPVAGLFVVIGHIFPVWLRFKGGKGVATAFGVFFALNIYLALIVCAMWLAAFMVTRISSLASMLSIGYSAIVAYLLSDDATALLCLNLAAIIIFTHRGNIKRLLQGTEYAFRKKKAL